MDIGNALLELAPGAAWSVDDNDYDQITWFTPEIPKPTREQVEAKVVELRAAEPIKRLRNHRDRLLSETDWVVAKYTEIGQSIPSDWKNYRQALRDLPETATPLLDFTNPLGISGVEWPVKP